MSSEDESENNGAELSKFSKSSISTIQNLRFRYMASQT
jgi:hypothetical protein